MKGNMRRRKVILGSAALIILPSAASARRDSLVRKWRLTQYDPHRCGFLVKGHPGGWERETRPYSIFVPDGQLLDLQSIAIHGRQFELIVGGPVSIDEYVDRMEAAGLGT